MKLYLCGPVSLGGTLSAEAIEKNLQAFYQTEKALRDAGYEVENPAAQHQIVCALPFPEQKKKSWSWYMRRTLVQMLLCEGVATLPRYEESPGCQEETRTAARLGMPVLAAGVWIVKAQIPR